MSVTGGGRWPPQQSRPGHLKQTSRGSTMKTAWHRARGNPIALLPLPVIWSLLAPHTAAAPDVAEGQKAWEYLATSGDTWGSSSSSLNAPLEVDAHVNTENVTVLINGVLVSATPPSDTSCCLHQPEEVYHVAGGARQGKSHFRPHSGVHLLVTGPRGVMMRQRFLTYQPAEHVDMAAALAAIQPERVVVLAAVPEFSLFLGQAGAKALDSLGFRWCSRMAWGEPWVGVAVTGRGVVAEAAATLQVGLPSPKSLRLSTVTQLRGRVPSKCSWYSKPGWEAHAAFCRQYEGYGDLCACRRPFSPHVRHQQARVAVKEEIPVVVVTANKPRHLYRLLRNLYTIEGGGQADVLVVIDSAHQETLALAGVMGVAALVHRPEGVRSNRTNANIRFALYSVFRHFPAADKAILLEDDLLLSPDFLSFFHQAAWVLDNDPTVFCVNAFNSNSLPDTAADASQLLRSESFPMYGWMVRRSYARQVITNWIPNGPGDWDWWLMKARAQRGRDVVSPEVSRTFHAGNAGEHVDGFEQHLYYSRILTTSRPDIRLRDLPGVVLGNYVRNLTGEIQRAELVTPDPRKRYFLPKGRPGPFVSFVRSGTRNDEFLSFRMFLMITRTYYWDTREIFRGVMRLRLQDRLFYIVGCPLSELFCQHKPRDVPVISPTPEVIKAVLTINNKYEQSLYEYGTKVRSYETRLLEETDFAT
ncbi:hypothetical protein O3P69_001896 [Scylla paramamosain]|uniref:Alpha-1,3-mannosyl-glycoprotein 2-beta-N-acetylglucosaminyltransferase n=1 Tax=Scylla paramamosain TaxID=85552 RepID=A0AAW0V1J7_SCYPA